MIVGVFKWIDAQWIFAKYKNIFSTIDFSVHQPFKILFETQAFFCGQTIQRLKNT